MSPLTAVLLAWRAVWRNRVRSVLTLLGISFGIGAVIAMVAAGQGARRQVHETFRALGTNVLFVSNGSAGSGNGRGAGSRLTLTWNDVSRLERAGLSTIRWMAPVLEMKKVQVTSEESSWSTAIVGTSGDWFHIRAWEAASGATFDAAAESSGAKCAVLGQAVAAELFSAVDPVGQTVRIQGQPYEVVGVLAPKGQGAGGNTDDLIVVPLKTFQQRLEKGVGDYLNGQIWISMTSEDAATETSEEVTVLLREWHRLTPDQDDDFHIRNSADTAQVQQANTERITTLLALVAAVSLFVGGLGVMNIMLMSVIERTREIGVRMAVGARSGDVMTQFLLESLTLALIGGVLGLGLGAVGAKYMADHFGWRLFFPATIAAIAFAVAGGVGVVFGLYPAVRASRLDPIAALRSES
ncbi:MAG: ABC transporter permease [Kofleriaceae bacterium]